MKNKITNYLWYYSFLSPLIFIAIFLVLGFITPGYDHLKNTISTLAIMKYGWIQQINFIQLGVSLIFSGYFIYTQLTQNYSRIVWKQIIISCILLMIILVIAPTDFIGSSAFVLSSLSLMGKVHLLALIIFFILAPLGIYRLQQALKKEPRFSHLSKLTALTGFSASIMCYIWIFFYFKSWFLAYLGILQKIIALIVLFLLIEIIYVARPKTAI